MAGWQELLRGPQLNEYNESFLKRPSFAQQYAPPLAICDANAEASKERSEEARVSAARPRLLAACAGGGASALVAT